MRNSLVLIGAGGLGKNVLWMLNESDCQQGRYHILGFVDDTPELQGTYVNGIPVIGTINWLSEISEDICAAICVGSAQGRHKIYQKLKTNPHISFPTFLAGNVLCADTASYGIGCIICNGGLLLPDSKLGDFVVINLNSYISENAVIGDYCTIQPSANISGTVEIGRGSEIGVGSSVIEKKKIGENVTIGAGAAVVHDIPSNSVAVGVPAKVIKAKPVYHFE